jgi:hypothetical protein
MADCPITVGCGSADGQDPLCGAASRITCDRPGRAPRHRRLPAARPDRRSAPSRARPGAQERTHGPRPVAPSLGYGGRHRRRPSQHHHAQRRGRCSQAPDARAAACARVGRHCDRVRADVIRRADRTAACQGCGWVRCDTRHGCFAVASPRALAYRTAQAATRRHRSPVSTPHAVTEYASGWVRLHRPVSIQFFVAATHAVGNEAQAAAAFAIPVAVCQPDVPQARSARAVRDNLIGGWWSSPWLGSTRNSVQDALAAGQAKS